MASGGKEHYQFEKSIDYFQCAICLDQLEEPMQCVNNEHSFCKKCIIRHLTENRLNCPTCHDPLTETTLRPSRLVANLLSQQIVPCKYFARGCRENVKRETLQDHVRGCGFCPVSCSNNGCVEIIHRKDQIEHQDTKCNFRKVKCEVCGREDVPYVDRKLHCYARKDAINEIKSSWEYEMACVKGKLGKIDQEFAAQWRNITAQINAMKVRLDNEISELKRDFSMSNGNTAHAIDEIKTEIHNIKRLMYDMQGKQKVMDIHINDIKDKMGQLSGQVRAISDRVDDTRGEIKRVRESNEQSHQDMQSEINSLRLLLLRLNKSVNTKYDIIIAGGQNNEHELNSVEIFSWATRTWSTLNNQMSLARSAASSFVYEGQMVISGGVSEDVGGSYNEGMECMRFSKLSTEQWCIFPSQLPKQYRRHKCLVYNNCIFIIGGRTSKTCDGMYKMSLNIPNDQLELVSKMAEPRQGHGAVLFGDSIIIVGGTVKVSRTCLDSVLHYDIEKQTFKTLAPLPIALSSMATVLWKDNIVIIGGRDNYNKEKREVIMYNITNETCTMLPSMEHQRSGCTAVIDGHLIVVMGGRNAEEGSLNTVEMFSFDSYHWQDLPPMNEKRWYATAVVKSDK